MQSKEERIRELRTALSDAMSGTSAAEGQAGALVREKQQASPRPTAIHVSAYKPPCLLSALHWVEGVANGPPAIVVSRHAPVTGAD